MEATMQGFARGLRALVVGLYAVVLLLGTMVAQAQDAAAPNAVIEPWQSVITSQIEAFRAG
jgi:heme A synthase